MKCLNCPLMDVIKYVYVYVYVYMDCPTVPHVPMSPGLPYTFGFSRSSLGLYYNNNNNLLIYTALIPEICSRAHNS